MTSFKRWLGAGAIVLVALALIACPGVLPTISKEIGDMDFVYADIAAKKAQTVTSLGDYFNVRDDATFKHRSSDPNVVKTSESGSTLKVTPIGSGTANVTVTATDRDGSVEQTFKATVKKKVIEVPVVNQKPNVRTIGRVALDVGETETVDLSEYFTDPEDDELTYTAESDDTDVATVARSGSMVTITAVDEGDAKVTVTAKDATNDAVRQTFSVDVGKENNQPRLMKGAAIPDVMGLKKALAGEAAATYAFNVSQYFTDDDGDELTFTASSDYEDVVTVATSQNTVSGVWTLTITVVDPGTATITVTADDGSKRDSNVHEPFSVEVLNEAPMATDHVRQYSLNMASDRNTATIPLSNHFTDREGDMLEYSVASVMPEGILTATVSGSTLTIEADGLGEATVTVEASDGMSNGDVANEPASKDLIVVVTDVPNKAPVVKGVGIPDQSLEMDFMAIKTFDVSPYFSDPDSGPMALTYDASSDMEKYATEMVDGSMLTIEAVAVGTAMVTVTVWDGMDDVSDTFDVMVTAPPVPRSLKDIPDLPEFAHDGAPVMLALSEYFDRATDYRVRLVPPNGVVTAVVSEDKETLTLTPAKAGSTVVEITPFNSGGDGTAESITVSVAEAPGPITPAGETLKMNGVSVDAEDTTVLDDLSTYFRDFESSDTYEASSSNEAVARATATGSTLTITGVARGTADITVTAKDGAATLELTFTVTVTRPASLAPIVSKALNDRLAEVGGMIEIDLTDHFSDPDGDPLIYSVTLTNSNPDKPKDTPVVKLADGFPNGNNFPENSVTIEAKNVGTVRVNVTARDFGRKSVSASFMVTVIAAGSNNAPAVVAAGQIAVTTAAEAFDGDSTPADDRLGTGVTKELIDNKRISDYFSDDDQARNARGDTLRFTVLYYDVATVTRDAVIETVSTESNYQALRTAKDDDDNDDSAYVMPIERSKAQASVGGLSSIMWDGDSSTFTVTVRGERGSSHDTPQADTVAIVATDEYGKSDAIVFQVRVNQAPKAEGAQASATPAGTPKKLSEETDYLNLQWLGDSDADGNERSIDFVADESGYFHDPDGDELTCSYLSTPSKDADAPADLEYDPDNHILTIQPDAEQGGMNVQVTCSDSFGHSATDTLRITVLGKSFSRR